MAHVRASSMAATHYNKKEGCGIDASMRAV